MKFQVSFRAICDAFTRVKIICYLRAWKDHRYYGDVTETRLFAAKVK